MFPYTNRPVHGISYGVVNNKPLALDFLASFCRRLTIRCEAHGDIFVKAKKTVVQA